MPKYYVIEITHCILHHRNEGYKTLHKNQGSFAQKTGQCGLCQEWLSDLRVRLKKKLELYSYSQASGEMGIHRNTMHKFLNGDMSITVGTLFKIKQWVEGT